MPAMCDGRNDKSGSGSGSGSGLENPRILRVSEYPAHPRDGIEEAYERWLSPIAWQVWGTATFPWNVRAETADAKFKEFLNVIEGTIKGRVCCAWARENRSKTRVDAVREHFHFQIAGRQEIPLELTRSAWRKLVHTTGNPSDKSIKVDPYDPTRGGLAYTFKHAGSGASEPGYHQLEYFHPELEPAHEKTRRPRRSLRLWNLERKRTSSVPAS